MAGNLQINGRDRHQIIITQITISLQLNIMRGKCRKLQEHKLTGLPSELENPQKENSPWKTLALHMPLCEEFLPQNSVQKRLNDPATANAQRYGFWSSFGSPRPSVRSKPQGNFLIAKIKQPWVRQSDSLRAIMAYQLKIKTRETSKSSSPARWTVESQWRE